MFNITIYTLYASISLERCMVLQSADHRPYSDVEYSQLKQATRHLVKACGGLEAAAAVTRVGHSELSRYYDPREKLLIPADIIADLERDCGRPILTQTLANLIGFELVQLPHTAGNRDDCHHWSALLALLGEETAALLQNLAKGLADHGTLSEDAIADNRLIEHLDNLLETAIQLRHTMLRKRERASRLRALRQPGNNRPAPPPTAGKIAR